MKPDPEFSNLPKSFWASVRSVSQEIGYTIRGEGQVKVPTAEEISDAFAALNLDQEKIISNGRQTALSQTLIDLGPMFSTTL